MPTASAPHLGEDELLDLVRGQRGLGDAPAAEAHLADCPSCSALLATLLASERGERGERGDDDAAARPDLSGRSLGPYLLGARIGAGAMGEVYRARDERLGRHVAIKVLSARVAGSAEQARRLEAEGRAAAAIAHPNVVTVYDVGEADGVRYIVSELIGGESLRSRIERGAVGRAAALDLGLQLARGLAAAHAQGVVHRDLKPHNLLVTDDGTLKILDFGLAKLSGERARELDATEPGTVLGTMGYLSPEQARGEPADARSDVFAVGAILYELLSGERAFAGASFAERLSAVLRDTPARLDAASLGDAAPVVARCLEKDPRRRFQSAQDLAWVLEGLRTPAPAAPAPLAPAPRPSRRAFLLGASAAAAAGLGGVLLGRRLAPARRTALAADSPAAREYQQLTYRHGRVTTARFTRDGGSVIYAAAWDDLPVSVYTARLGGGGTRGLELPSADVLAVSARGELALSLGRRYVDGFHQAGQLALVPLEGGEPRVLADAIQDADFTPDGRELAVVRRVGKAFRLELPAGKTLLEHPGWLSHPRVSPDGTRVAVLTHPSPDDDRGEVVVVERAGARARTLAADFSSVAGLAWSPDGRTLWFGAARAGANNAVHSLALAPGATPTVVAQTTGRLRLHDLAPDGRLAISHDDWRLRLMVRPPGASAEVDLSLTDVSTVGALSTDGATLVFDEFGDVESASGCYLRSTSGGTPMRLGDGMARALSDDGGRVVAQLWGMPAPLVVYATRGGEPVTLASAPIADVRWVRFAGAERVIVGGAARGRPPRLWQVSLVPGARAAVPLTDEGVFGIGFVDPAATRVAFIGDDGQLRGIRLDTPGAPFELPAGRFADDDLCGWRDGGAELFVRSRSLPVRIRRIDLGSGAVTPHLEIAPPRLGLKGVDGVVVSASGNAYAYSYGQELSRLYAMREPARLPTEPRRW